jgi:hypothetical protein
MSFEREIQDLFADREVRRAKLPLNMAAVTAADNDFYGKYRNDPRLVRDGKRIPLDPNDPAQAQLRSEWMDLYIKHCGEVEGQPPPCPSTGGLSVKVVDQNRVPVPRAAVRLERGPVLQTGSDGVAGFGTVFPGAYSITVDKSGFDSAQVSVLVSSGASHTETVMLTRFRPAPIGGPDDKIVYLTFDDGIMAGTEETYRLLNELDVRATFFCVGENVEYHERTARAGLFREMYDNLRIQIANHSHTHAHQFYETYYDTGLRVNKVTLEPDAECVRQDPQTGKCAVFRNPGLFRSVLMDFEYAGIAFAAVLSQTVLPRPASPPFDFRGTMTVADRSAYPRFLTARMPGSNIWRLSGIRREYGEPVPKRVDEAGDLERNGYEIYGWDLQWDMSFESVDLIQKDLFDGGDGRIAYSGKPSIDRPTVGAGFMFRTVQARLLGAPDPKIGRLHKRNKLILLMHERAFRFQPGPDKSKYLNYLRDFIVSCKNAGYKFDIVANY